MERLTSLKNPKVQLWRSLKDGKARRETGLFLVEGVRMVEEALASGWTVEALLLQEGEKTPAGVQAPVYVLPEVVLSAICDTKSPQGIAAVLRSRSAMLLRPEQGIWAALDGVQDPGNVGTIIRTADAAGLAGILLSPTCADVHSPKVLRATMGSFFRMPLLETENLPAFLRELREEGFSILSSELGGTSFYERKQVSAKAVLVIGNEGNGISAPVRAVATHHLALPMRGGAESLNAAVAAGIMMYELMRAY